MKAHLPVETIIESIEHLKHQNRYGEARLTALDALARHTDDYRLYEELADIYLFEENLEKAEEVIAYARTLHPESWTGIYLEGYIAVVKWDFDHAIDILTRANILIPNNAEIIRNLGWSYVMKGEVLRWISLLRRAHALAPDEMSIVNDLGIALMSIGRETEAHALFEQTGNTLALEALRKIQ